MTQNVKRNLEGGHEKTVGEGLDGARLDKALAEMFVSLSRSQAAKLIKKEGVLLNGILRKSPSVSVSAADCIEISQQTLDSFLVTPAQAIEGEPIPLTVRYDDDFLAVIAKEPHIVCHPSPGHETHTLVNALIARYGKEGLATLQGPDKLGLVHRLDMDTSGLMLIAKDDETQRLLQDAIKARAIDRRYLTLVHGYIAPKTGLIDVGMARSSRHRIKMMATDDPSAREALTTFKTLEHFDAAQKDDGFTLLECHLLTGRTHQIRLHMNYIHHPVVGDPLYGTGSPAKNLFSPRQFLHSYKLAFTHPRTGEALSFSEPLPDDLAQVLASLKGRSLGKVDFET